MADIENTIDQHSQPLWPLPNDPRLTDASEQTRAWVEAGQPEALAAWFSDTIKDAFHALSNLALAQAAWPKAALDNAMAQLPET